MVAAIPNDRIPSAESKPVPPVVWLAERDRYNFGQHPEMARGKFLLDALRREIDFLEQREMENEARPAGREREGTNRYSTARPPLMAEDIRLHAWLTERLVVVHYEQHGLWPKLRRFLLGNRLLRWLGNSLLGPGMGESEGKRR
jgi:hypothetical protein